MNSQKNNPDKIIVHHTADTFEGLQFDKVNIWHKQRDFPVSSFGYFIGYHYFIERNGTVKQGRKDSDVGAHTKGQNFTSIGIGLAGNFNKESPTIAQKVKLGSLCKEIMVRFNIPITQIFPHRKYSATSCYGAKLEEKWAAYNVIEYQIGQIAKIISWLRIKLNL